MTTKDFFDTPKIDRLRARAVAAKIEIAVAKQNWSMAYAAIAEARAEADGLQTATTVADMNFPPKLTNALDRHGIVFTQSLKGRSRKSLASVQGIGPGWAKQVFDAIRANTFSVANFRRRR